MPGGMEGNPGFNPKFFLQFRQLPVHGCVASYLGELLHRCVPVQDAQCFPSEDEV